MSPPPLPAPGADTQPQTVDSFLKTVLRSGLLTSPQLQKALQPVAGDKLKDPHFLADHLVKIGKLSRFQANKLLQGATLGLVLGPYHVLAPIGKGGMGVVYLARDSRSQALVAVKVLPPKRAKAEERLLARFKREMEICQRVDHAHLARAFGAGVHDGVNYIVMEYIPGRNLYKLVMDQGILTVPRAARIFQEIAQGLEHAHGLGLIHRDMKPSNVVITIDDRAKVLDLGLALMQGEVAADRTVVGGQGYVVGTLDYLAPEQAEDAFTVDPRADIYSLGCTLYFALTKQPPFPGGNALQKLLRHRCDQPAPLASLNPEVPPELVAVVNRMMSKRREERYANAADVRAALATWAPEAARPRVQTEPPKPAAAPRGNGTAPAPTAPSKPEAAPQAQIPTPAVIPQKETSSSWFVEMAGKPDAPAAMTMRASRKQLDALMQSPAALAALGGPAEPPIVAAAPIPPEVFPSPPPEAVPVPGPAPVPFWLDYIVPVAAGGLFLFVVWVIGLILLLRK